MKRQLLIVGLVVASLATFTYAASPGVGPMAHFGGPLANSALGRTISGCVGRLITLRADMNVTDDQRTQIRDVLMSHRPEIASTVKSVRDARTDLRDLVLSDTATESEIRAAADALGKQISDAAVKAAKLRKEIAPVLTTEQKELVREFLSANDTAVDEFLTTAAAGN